MPSRNRRDKQQEGLQGIQWSTLPNNPLRIQELPLASRRLSPPSTRLSTHPPISPRQPLGGSMYDQYAPTLHQDPRLLRVPSRDRQYIMHMALLRVRDGPISIGRVRPVQAEPLGEA